MNAPQPIPGITTEELAIWERVQTAIAIHFTDRRLKNVCSKGHPRIPTNVTAAGQCRECVRAYDRNRNTRCACGHYRRKHEDGKDECYGKTANLSPCECEAFVGEKRETGKQ